MKAPSSRPSRRQVLGFAATAATIQIVPARVLGQGGEKPPSEKLNIGFVGAGGRGSSNINGCKDENVYALTDVDAKRCAQNVRKFTSANYHADWREMLDKDGANLDAVVVSTPDHNHAVAALAAMQMGKHVYVEKPLTRTISEARILQQAAKKYKVCTQMGNQGHAAEGARLTNEWIQSGALGEVAVVHTRSNRPGWPQDMLRPAAEEVPPTLDWDVWLGPAPDQPYSSQIVPFKWRGYVDYGTGAMGDMGAHIVDHPVWALDLGMPTSVEATRVVRNTPGSEKVSFPQSCEITYEFPAKGDRPAVKLVWYDGKFEMPRPEGMDEDRKVPGNGCIYYGSEFTMMHGSHGGKPSLISKAQEGKFEAPGQTMERSPGHHKEWIQACKANDPSIAKSNFDYAAPLTERMLLGVIACQVGEGTKLTWDAEAMKTGNEAADAMVHHEYRKGWSLEL